MYNEILVPVDGSISSNEALRHGMDFAQKYDATVHLLYVVDKGFRGRYHEIEDIEDVESAIERAGEKALQTARERVEASSLPVAVHLEHTIPHRGIIETSQEVGADLIVMGTERRSGECRNLIGSATERVVRMSAGPVHVVKTEPGEHAPVDIRTAMESDLDEIRAIARHSMETSYSAFLPEMVISDAVDKWYGGETGEELLSDPDTCVLVAEMGDTVVGFSQSHLVETPAGTIGEIHWLHVDPEYRGEGIGTELFNRTRATLEDRDVSWIRAFVLTDYDPGNAFYEARELESIGSRTVKISGKEYKESVYATRTPEGEPSPPRIESRTTGDGETLFINYEESEIGSEGPFFTTYATRDLETRYGWFCSNCESFDVAMDTMERIVCNECGNHHKATRWDAVVTE